MGNNGIGFFPGFDHLAAFLMSALGITVFIKNHFDIRIGDFFTIIINDLTRT